MAKPENIEDFYLNRLDWMLHHLTKELGQFNVFRVKDFVGPHAKPVPFNRRDYYKITLAIGKNRYLYADKVVETDQPALLFTNPMIPYKCERLGEDQQGYFCIFTDAFFARFGNIKDYPVFKPDAIHVFFPSEKEIAELQLFFEQLFTEIESDYTFKYDLIRAQTLQVIHKAIKMKPVESSFSDGKNANARIASLFIELLERQFPIESPLQHMQLRSPADFAEHLSVHTNHLNRALKAVIKKTTSQLIKERIQREACVLLKHTNWTVAEIGYSLRFEEPSHFISFFKNYSRQTPGHYRNAIV